MTKTTRTIGTITIASSFIRTIGAIVKICKRLNGNHSRMTRTIEAIQMYPKIHLLFQDSMLFLHCVPKNALQNGTTNTREWRRSSCISVWCRKRQNFRINPYFIMHSLFFFKKTTAQSIDYLWDFTLCFTGLPPKNVASPGPNRAVSLLRRSRRLYGNQKSPLSCRSSGSLQNIFETNGAIGTVKWKPGLTISSYCCKTIAIPNKN